MAMPNMPTGAKTRCRSTASMALSDESAAIRRTSGHNKKSAVEIATVKKRKNVDYTTSKTTIRIPTKESEFCETIVYDEHMDQGIPQTLLDGLGFHPEANGSNDDDDERISDLSHLTSRDTGKAMLVARGHVLPLSSPSISSISKKSRKSKTSQPYSATHIGQPSCHQSTSGLSPSDSDIYQSNLPIDLSKRASQNPTPSSPARPCSNITRGNIQYAHHPQGYVVARIVRDEPKPPSKRRSRARNSESSELNPQLVEIVEGCPFNENNVEEVLGELMEHTDAMRRKMASMKDDMRRVCGTGASLRTKEQQNKGIEVSQRLQKAYLSYTMALENIERWNETQNDEEQAGNAS